ncbi:MAG: archaemetzincin family Zn-dependent metalloprotease [Thermoplasmata archaeon]|nr:MAG: archaemetzincin family Zn-dependent metalloprotease [Thermoplasmata archaeon]
MLSDRLSYLPFEISILTKALIPEKSFNAKRDQYESSYFLELIRKHPGDKVLGVVDLDLYSEPLNFVFGQAEISGKAAVISLFRLKGEKSLFETRAVKEAVHEIGHLFGLRHCPNTSCVMHFSNCLEETDTKEEKYCEDCEARLRWMGLI